MKHWMETWAKEQRFGDATQSAFDEAFIGFKAGAYKAALVFSYIGMNLCLRHRLMRAKCPDSYNEIAWSKKQRELLDDDSWDAHVFDLTQAQTDGKRAFEITVHLREEVKYWKNRRNDCAHFKKNEIQASHVESFWFFLKSNLGKLVPGGSTKDIVNRLFDHYDSDLTQPGTDVSPIIAEIPHAVEYGKLGDFLTLLEAKFTKELSLPLQIVVAPILGKGPMVEVVEGLLILGKNTEELAEWLLDRTDDLLPMLLRTAPQLVSILADHPKEVRKLWTSQLFIGQKDLAILASLLKSGLIPETEVPELLERAAEDTGMDVLNDSIFESAGFWTVFDKNMDERLDNFKWANANSPLIAYRVSKLIEVGEFSKKLAENICGTFRYSSHPYGLLPPMCKTFAYGSEAYKQLEKLAKDGEFEIPDRLVPEPALTDKF